MKTGIESSVKKNKLESPLGWMSKGYNRLLLPSLHNKYLEDTSELWAIAIDRKKELQGKRDLRVLNKLARRQEEVVRKACGSLKNTLYNRLPLYQLYDKGTDKYRKSEDEKCKNNFVYWVNRYGWTSDPRNANMGFPVKLPFILWKRQAHLAEMMEYWYRINERAVIEKSRATGLSWLAAAWAAWHWLYTPGFSVGFGSQKQKFVDESGFPGSLFYKIRYIIYNLPRKMIPAPFLNRKNNKYDLSNKITHPEIGSFIIGDQGKNIGRGDRTSVYFVDEKASVEDQQGADDALSQTTNSQFDISTPRGMNHFYEKRFSGKHEVYTMWWYYDPSKNPVGWKTEERIESPWRKLQDMKYDEVTVAQEIEIDYACSVGGLFMKKEWVESAVNLDIPEGDEIVAGFDVAGGGKNKSIYGIRKGTVVYEPITIDFKTPNEAALKVIDLGEKDKIDKLNYDEDGLGVAVLGVFNLMEKPIKFKTMGIHGNASPPDVLIPEEGRTWKEKVRNMRAANWCKLRKRFQRTYEHVKGIRQHSYRDMISIPNNRKLVSQLCSPLEKYTPGGKILVESKESMRSRNVESPDLADMLVYQFADAEFENKYISNFDYTENKEHYKDFNVDFSKTGAKRIVSIYQSKDLRVGALVAMWSRGSQTLKVVKEYLADVTEPDDLKDYLISQDMYKIDLYIGNKEIFNGIEKDPNCAWFQYKKNGMTLKQNYYSDSSSGMLMINSLFKQDKIQIHKDCNELVFQLDSWSKIEKKMSEKYLLALSLCQIVNFLKKKRVLVSQYIEVDTYGRKRFEKVGQNKLDASNVWPG